MRAASASAAAARLLQGSFGKRRDWVGARAAVGSPHHRFGATPEPGLGPTHPVPSPGLGLRSPGAYLLAPGSPELPRRPRRPKRAPNP